MRHSTHALVLASEVPAGTATGALVGDEHGLFAAWEGLPGCPFDAVVWPEETDRTRFLGVVIALGQNGDSTPDVPGINVTVALDALSHTEPYATAMRVAHARWRVFAGWCASRGTVLHSPRVWLVPIHEGK